jgi:cytochrome P450
MTTTRSIAELPAVPFTDADIFSGALPLIFARAAMKHGPILRHVVAHGPEAGEGFVFMVGPEANRFVLHTHRDLFSHEKGWTPIIGESLGKGLLTMDDPEHARHRRMWNPAFTAAYMATYLPVMRRVIAQRTASWAAQGTVDVYRESREITFDVAAAALAGIETGAEVDRMRELFYTLLHVGPFDAEQESWEQVWQRLLGARDELARHLLARIAERRAAPAGEQPRDVLGVIVRASDEQGQALNDAQILAHLNILLVAGHETTTTLAAWTLYLLATQPEWCARIQEELEALPPDDDGALSLEALRAAKLLDAFIREVGRLYPPVINVPRGVVAEYEFAGYSIPAGTQVRLALAAGQLLPQVFADPEVFDPTRFLLPREEDKKTPYALVTFGGGPRICIGINVAQVEVKALVAQVLRSYRLEAAGPHPPVHGGHWTAVIPDGIWLRVSPR